MAPEGVELCLEAYLPRQVMLLGVWLTKDDGWTETVDKPLRTVLVPFLDMEKGPVARQGSLCLSLAVFLSLSCLWGEIYTFCWFYSNTKHVKQKKVCLLFHKQSKHLLIWAQVKDFLSHYKRVTTTPEVLFYPIFNNITRESFRHARTGCCDLVQSIPCRHRGCLELGMNYFPFFP